jgi:hypothetical protein
VVVDGGAKIRSTKTGVECVNSVSSDTNKRSIFLEMVLERTKLKDSEKIYMLLSPKLLHNRTKNKTEIEGISASFCFFSLGKLYICTKRWLSLDVHKRKKFQIYLTVQNNQGNDSKNALILLGRQYQKQGTCHLPV